MQHHTAWQQQQTPPSPTGSVGGLVDELMSSMVAEFVGQDGMHSPALAVSTASPDEGSDATSSCLGPGHIVLTDMGVIAWLSTCLQAFMPTQIGI